MFAKFKAKSVRALVEIFWNEFFMIRNPLKIGQSGCSAVVCRKRRAFAMKFHLIVVSVFLEIPQIWRILKILCMYRVRSLLSMHFASSFYT